MLDLKTIATASPEAATALTHLHNLAFGEAAWSQKQIQDSLAQPSSVTYAALREDEIAGFIMLQESFDEAEILTFAVAPTFQRKGIGEALLRHAMDNMRNKALFLEVATDNIAACQLYTKMRFELVGRRPNYYKRDNNLVDALTFRRAPFASSEAAC